MSRRFLPRPAAGFTLMELQIALLLVALISVITVGGLRLGIQTWQRVAAREDSGEHDYRVAESLRRHLQNMRFIELATVEGEQVLSFIGGPDYLHFVAPWPTYYHDDTLYWWTLKSVFSEQNQSYQLLLEHQPFDRADELGRGTSNSLSFPDKRPQTLLLADQLRLVGTRVHGRDQEGVAGWFGQWLSGQDTPSIVMLQLENIDSAGVRQSLPELAVLPRFASQELVSARDL